MFASILIVQVYLKHYSFPAQAIQRNINGDPQVYVINAKGMADIRPIELGPQYEQYYIASKGLKTGDKVVVGCIDRIQPNQKLELATLKSSYINE